MHPFVCCGTHIRIIKKAECAPCEMFETKMRWDLLKRTRCCFNLNVLRFPRFRGVQTCCWMLTTIIEWFKQFICFHLLKAPYDLQDKCGHVSAGPLLTVLRLSGLDLAAAAALQHQWLYRPLSRSRLPDYMEPNPSWKVLSTATKLVRTHRWKDLGSEKWFCKYM